MFPPKRILFPVDFSERCAGVAPMAAAFARKFESELMLIHVKNPALIDRSGLGPESKLKFFAAREEFKGLNIRTMMPLGDPAAEIIRFAHDVKTDLIFMPTHGYGTFRRFLLGSVTLKVLHDAWCPVWTDAHNQELPASIAPQFRSIVCAVDLSDKARPAIDWAWKFAQANRAKMVLVHAVPLLTTYGAEYVPAEWQDQIAASAQKQLDSLQHSEQTSAPVQIVLGEVANAVRTAAEDEKADLLVIGRSLDDGPLGRLRTHAYSIVRHSPCPVVSV
jgi:nucleotide-binding universal stress UspA family protein